MFNQEQLKENLHYNEETGVFTRIKPTQGAGLGDIAGCLDKSTGYLVIAINGKRHKAHRLAWMYVYGEFPAAEIDHINHARNDNRILNLRAVTRQENLRNARKSKANTSGITGVGWNKRDQKWYAQIRVDGKHKHLGYFHDKFEAICARKSAEIKNGYHANHGK